MDIGFSNGGLSLTIRRLMIVSEGIPILDTQSFSDIEELESGLRSLPTVFRGPERRIAYQDPGHDRCDRSAK